MVICQKYANFINGIHQAQRGDFAKISPISEEPIGYFPQSTAAEVNEAVAAAKNSWSYWRKLSRVKRADYFDQLAQVIKKRKDQIAEIISIETGKTVNESMAEVIESLHMIQFTFGKGREPYGELVASEIADRDCMVIRKPKGVVGIIAPWNFPFAIAGAWTAAPALLEGNTVVIKPSEDSPLSGAEIGNLYAEAGFPAGVINVIHGDGRTGAMLAKHDDVKHICFTGSAEVGQSIRMACASSWDKTCSCEMGSKSAVIVFEDGDLDLAAEAAANSAFKLSGQRCVSSGRILVQRSVFSIFQEKFLAIVKKAVVNGPYDSVDDIMALRFGPVINAKQRERVEFYNSLVREDRDATVLWDQDGIHGRLPAKGFYLRPFVYRVEWGNKRYLKEEVFGPHVALIPFDSVDDAIRIYNDTDYGLSLGAVTNDFRTMRRVREECDAGMMYFNLGSIGAESHTVFGGVKKSGNGSPSAAGTFEAVTHQVTVSVNHASKINFPQGLRT